MLVYVCSDDSLRTQLVKIDHDSPPHHKELAIELPDELVVRYQKAESEHVKVQELLKKELHRRRA